MSSEQRCVPAILFVDDDKVLLDTFERMFRSRQDWDLVFAQGGAIGMSLLRARKFDVVVSDYEMPDVGGDAVLELAAELQPTARRILLTGSSVDETRVNAHRLLYKPFDVAHFRRVLVAAVELPPEQFVLTTPG